MTDIDREFNAMCDKEAEPSFTERSGHVVFPDGRTWEFSEFTLDFSAEFVQTRAEQEELVRRILGRSRTHRLTQTHNTTEDHDR